MKHLDLQTIYADLAARLPVETDGSNNLALTAQNLPPPPIQLTTGELYILRREHCYNDWFKIDLVDFFARKETYRRLGLLILSVIFHRIPAVSVELQHSYSEIKSLTVEYHYQNINELSAGYYRIPFAFEYCPGLPGWHPFNRFGGVIDPKDLPCFHLANSTNRSYTNADWQQRDQVKIFGSDAGLVLFAELLLNIGLPQNEETEFALECESGGNRAVGVNSHEANLFFPIVSLSTGQK